MKSLLTGKTTLIIVLLFNCFITAQQQDTTKDLPRLREKPVQYRRGIELSENYQSYGQKYLGKNLDEEKRKLFPLVSTGVWTELNPKVPRVDYLGINFVNKDLPTGQAGTGWAVGDLGALIKSTDGGTSWTVSETNTTTPILKVRSYDGQIVIASGFGGLILRSTDGGETFTQVTSNVTGDLWGLQMINDTLGWACGNANSLIKTADGGQTWQNIETPGYTSDYWWIDFMNENYGFIAANGKVLRTTDGGTNWEIIQAGDAYPLFSIDVIDSLHIAAAGYGGTSYPAKNIYSSDGGNTWVTGGMMTTSEVNCIKYISIDTGYVVMSNIGIWKTTNRGQNWTITGGIGEYELQYIEEGRTGYNTGTGLKLWKAEGSYDVWKRMIINDNFADVFFTSEQKGFVVSPSYEYGSLYKTNDSGISWNVVNGAPSGNELLFLDSLTGFVGSYQINKTTDGGVTWYVPNGGQGGAGKIFFVNQEIGWAVRSNVIYKSTDRGENWFTQFTAPASVHFTSINFSDTLYGWVSGGRPYKTTDGGNNWIQQTNTIIWNSDDVYFTNTDSGWFAKYSSINNSLFKTIDGGLTWTGIPEVIGARKFYFFPDPIHWVIIGFSQYYITNDYSNTWYEFTNDVPTGINSFYAPTNIQGYAVGSLGLVLSYNDTTYIPVELIDFSAEYTDNKIHLSWITVTEINNLGFELFRSYDNNNWVKIGFVRGAGTTTEKSEYSFIDHKIYGSKIYYQIKQIDFNGTFEYSTIIEIEISSLNFYLSQNYPNPANPIANISFTLPQKSFVEINLYSINGELVKQILNEEKEKGIYNLEVKLNDFASGVYFYKMTTDKGFYDVKKLVLLK
ncbi:MAG: T9SS type A sorting domain-containing protein [Ignavibacteriaceae bacterium]|nr:T9SS type A sorting domain-containing protein [Ignavibacteriaceae bacterium]